MNMLFSDNINEIAAAFAKAQAELTNPTKGRENPHFKSKYADIADGLDVVRPVFSKHGIAVLQVPEIHDGEVILRTQFMHSSGQWLAGFYPVCKVAPHQAMGAAMTYAKRQSLFAMAGIAGDNDDDDGNSAAVPTSIKSLSKSKQLDAPKPNQTVDSPALQAMTVALKMCKDLAKINEWVDGNNVSFGALSDDDWNTLEGRIATMRKVLVARNQTAPVLA
jgi:hypothetical protein